MTAGRREKDYGLDPLRFSDFQLEAIYLCKCVLLALFVCLCTMKNYGGFRFPI